ncbi:MAG TPA: hypothetical protein EYN59_08175 [Candidatus Marinimicrobia bacterium]|nr:hypothetical protein [Candidatus Neomarinimicrobiota bacterium]
MILNSYQVTEKPSRAVIGLHGWTGDEYSMEPIAISVKALSAKWVMPRAPYKADTGEGYTWFSGSDETGWKYDKTLEMMPELITKVSSDGFENRHIFFVGFSMGAGLSLLTAGRLPFQVGGVVAISGFIKNRELFTSKMTKQSLGTPILILHGNHDKLVLSRKAEETVDFLKNLGYSVRYLTYDAGHKVPNEAMHIINSFIEDDEIEVKNVFPGEISSAV